MEPIKKNYLILLLKNLISVSTVVFVTNELFE